MYSGPLRCLAARERRLFAALVPSGEVLKAQLYYRHRQQWLRPERPPSLALTAMHSVHELPASSFRNIFRRELVFVRLVRFTASSFHHCLAEILIAPMV